jgi:hypothetical protein
VQDLEVFKGYVPSSKASHQVKGSLRPIARIAADVFVFNTDKIRNPQIFDDFAKILTSTLFRTEYRLKEKYASAFDEPKKGLTTMQLTKGIKEELGLPNGEIQEIVQLIGLKENSQEVHLEKVVSNPFLPEISIPANSCSLTLVEIIRVLKDFIQEFVYMDIEGQGYLSHLEASKIFNNPLSGISVKVHPKLRRYAKRHSTGSSEVTWSTQRRMLGSHSKHETAFDYVMFISQMFQGLVEFSINDMLFDSGFKKIARDMAQVSHIKEKIEARESNLDLRFPSLKTSNERLGSDVAPPPFRGRVSELRNSSVVRVAENAAITVQDESRPGTGEEWRNREQSSLLQRSAEKSVPILDNSYYSLMITIVGAEGLIHSSPVGLPNSFCRVSFNLYSPEKQKQVAKWGESEVEPRNSNPQWQIEMGFKFSNLAEFYRRNIDQDMCIEVLHREGAEIDTSLIIPIMNVNCPIFAEISEKEIEEVLLKRKLEIRKSMVTAGNKDRRTTVRWDIELFRFLDSENPFKDNLYENLSSESDAGKRALIADALMKTKKTIEDLRTSNAELDDYELLADQNMIQMLKDTLKESAQYQRGKKSGSNSEAQADEGVAESDAGAEEGRYPDEEDGEGEYGVPDYERDDLVAPRDRQKDLQFKTFQNDSLADRQPARESDSDEDSNRRINGRVDHQPVKPIDAADSSRAEKGRTGANRK